jgi:hypothetical protein
MTHDNDPETMPAPVDLSSLRLSDDEAAALWQRVRSTATPAPVNRPSWWGLSPKRTRQIALVASLTALAEAACVTLLPRSEPSEAVTQLLEAAAFSGRKLSPRDVYLARLAEKP